MGDGFVISPKDGTIVSPASGVVELIFPTNHAIVIKTLHNRKILIHLGINTVSLNGKGFESLVKTKDNVTKGQPILKMDLDFINKNAKSSAIPVIFTNLKPDEFVYFKIGKRVKAGQQGMIGIHKKR